MPGKKNEKLRSEVRELIRNKRLVTAVYFLLRLSVILVLIAQVFNRNFENVFLCVLTLFLFTVPTILERRLRIDIPNTLEIIILLFIYAAEILGEIQAFYLYIPNWDTMLHTMNGFLCAGHRIFPAGHSQPEREGKVFAVPPVPCHCGILLFHDGRCAVGVLRGSVWIASSCWICRRIPL